MKLSKYVLLAGTAFLGLAMSAGPVFAAAAPITSTATVTASLTTDSGITAADGDTMEFGTWLIGVNAGDEVTLVMDTAGAIVEGSTGTAQVIQLDNTGVAPGTVTVDLPTGADGIVLQMERGPITQFTDTAIVLSDITYVTATETEAAVAEATPVPVTVVTGGTPEEVAFGATITATDTSPADATHTATFDVTFSY
jgi:hypothetical protein